MIRKGSNGKNSGQVLRSDVSEQLIQVIWNPRGNGGTEGLPLFRVRGKVSKFLDGSSRSNGLTYWV